MSISVGDQGVSAILLFGSRAREDNSRGSDTDLLLISPPGEPQHKAIGHLSMFFYPWEKLAADARDGDLFVCHIVHEAKPVFDPLGQLDDLRRGHAQFAGDLLDGAAGLIDGEVLERGIDGEVHVFKSICFRSAKYTNRAKKKTGNDFRVVCVLSRFIISRS